MTTLNTTDDGDHWDNQGRDDPFLAALPLIVQAINARNEERARLLRSQSALDCESISATEQMLREIVGARVELQAIAKSNARIKALLERSVLSEGEPIRTTSPDPEAASSNCPCGGRTITHKLIGRPTPRWFCDKCGASGDDDPALSRSTNAANSATVAAHLACQALTARGAEYPKASGPLSGPRKQK